MAVTSLDLPPHLELLVSDGPVLDVYSAGPCLVPDELRQELADKLNALAQDPKSVKFTVVDPPDGWTDQVPGVVLEAYSAFFFLAGGSGGIRAGKLARLADAVTARWDTTSSFSVKTADTWYAQGSGYRPPAYWLANPPDFWVDGGKGNAEIFRWDALELARDVVALFEPVGALQPRVKALLRLYDARLAGDGIGIPTADLAMNPAALRADWAAAAPDDVLEILPELAGPTGYFGWVWQGLEASHARLAEVTAMPSLATALSRLLVQSKAGAVPAVIGMVAGQQMADAVAGELPKERGTYKAEEDVRPMTGLLTEAALAGRIEACRMWLDMSCRAAAILKGYPGNPVYPADLVLPVGAFQRAVRELARPRLVSNPFAAALARGGTSAAGEETPPVPESAGGHDGGSGSSQRRM